MEKILELILKYKLYVKFLISGGLSTFTDLFLLFIFHSILKMNVVVAATLAFVLAFFVSFYLQKFWTFRENSTHRIKLQLFFYFVLGAMGVAINAGAMHILVNVLHIWYLLAQILISAAIAIMNFLVYRFFIFKKLIEI